MRVRLLGTSAEVVVAMRHLAHRYRLVEVSPPMHAREGRHLVRIYFDARPKPDRTSRE